MSFATPAPTPPAEPAPVPTPPAEPGAQPQPAADAPLHPSLEAAMTGIPELLQRPLREQLRTTEREHQQALEAARQNSAPPEWAQLSREAAQLGITPQELINAHNAAQRILTDPVGFSIELNNQIDKMIDDGKVTPKEGYRMKQAVQQEVAAGVPNPADLLGSPEDAALQAANQKIADLESRFEQAQTAEQDRQMQADADQYAKQFMTVLSDSTAGATPQQVQFIGRYANDYLANDTTGRLTIEQAVAAAVESAKGAGITWTPPADPAAAAAAAAQQAAIPPVGSTPALPGAPAAQPLPKHDTAEGRQAREARMMAAAEAAKLLPGDD